ncbi:MAG: hypothetical protein ACXVIL_09870 [Halobacteriota archaeon]
MKTEAQRSTPRAAGKGEIRVRVAAIVCRYLRLGCGAPRRSGDALLALAVCAGGRRVNTMQREGEKQKSCSTIQLLLSLFVWAMLLLAVR